jgi:hypothetical protein
MTLRADVMIGSNRRRLAGWRKPREGDVGATPAPSVYEEVPSG